MKKIKKILPFILFLITFSVFSQTGFVTGTVSDGELNDILPYANVVVKNTTKGTTTDFDGKYSLELEAGTYTIEYSFLGYETKAITDVVVKANQDVVLDVSIKPANSLDEVVITTSSKRNTESALLNIQKKSGVMLDGLSLQSIKKTGAGDIAAAVKSVPGVSVQGGKYVYVRGLGDRYTKSILNGVDIPGLDPDRNTIPMDIFPTNIIDNVIVLKSASAEYPADFTGGIVNIVTKDFPTKAEYSLSVGTGYNPDMHFNDNYLNYEGSKSDFLGYDNGLRNRKINRYQSIPATFENKQLLTSLTSRFESQLGADVERSNANFNFGFTLGNQYEVNDTDKIGYQASFNYKNTTRFYEDRVDGNYTRDLTNGNLNNELVTDRIVTGSSGHNEILVNGLLGLTYKTERSKYKLTGLHIQNGESTAGKYNILISEGGAGGGLLNASGDELLYTQRSITNFSLVGDHALNSKNDLTLDWVFSPSFSSVQDKDHRTTALRVVNVGNETQYQIDPSSVGNPTRIWRNLSEENWVLNANMSKKYQLFNKPAKVKFGGGFTYKYRDFNTDQYLFEATSPIVENGDVNTILAEENLWTPSTGTGTYLDSNNIFQPENSYEGESNIAAFYVSNEFNVTEKFKAILGVRSEQFLSFYTGIIDGEAVT
ncbi:MAG: carboxypeptidase-like regulatory domain-containing protein, partial [Olleya sp.]